MTFRNIAMIAASGLLLASPLAAQAAMTKATTAKVANTTCKGLHGKTLKTCKQNMKKAAK
ncbi:MAG: hypothetical protein ABIT09_08210 [Croceibacterium sp.]